jgi:hypothetical protein
MKINIDFNKSDNINEDWFKTTINGYYANYPIILDNYLKTHTFDELLNSLSKFELNLEHINSLQTLILVNFNRNDKLNFIKKYKQPVLSFEPNIHYLRIGYCSYSYIYHIEISDDELTLCGSYENITYSTNFIINDSSEDVLNEIIHKILKDKFIKIILNDTADENS